MLRLSFAISCLIVLGLSTPVFAGIVQVLSADFNSDVVGDAPDASLPGDPSGDRISFWRSSGYSEVSAGSGVMADQPLKINKPDGGGITRFHIAPDYRSCESYVLRWTTMIEGPQAATNFTLRDISYNTIAVLGFQGSSLWTGLGTDQMFPDVGIPSAYGVAFAFELRLDRANNVYDLFVNDSPVPGMQGYPAYGGDLDRIEVAFGGLTPHFIYVDDLSISADCSSVAAEPTSWGQLKSRF